MAIAIQPIHSEADYRAVEQLQREIWGAEDIEIISHDLLLTAQKNGGIVLGAFDLAASPALMVGFSFGFVGLTPRGEVKLCSHVTGVKAAYQNQKVGYLLKLAQRERALKQGITLITWTFDPLESRNARFNFHKLGATCNTFLPNVYGEMRDELNAGLPSDRFQADWRIASAHVAASLQGTSPQLLPSSLLTAGVPLLNALATGERLEPPREVAPFVSEQLLVEIPTNFQQLKAADFALARVWRRYVREVFEAAFAHGYTAVDLLVEEGRSYYLLHRAAS